MLQLSINNLFSSHMAFMIMFGANAWGGMNQMGCMIIGQSSDLGHTPISRHPIVHWDTPTGGICCRLPSWMNERGLARGVPGKGFCGARTITESLFLGGVAVNCRSDGPQSDWGGKCRSHTPIKAVVGDLLPPDTEVSDMSGYKAGTDVGPVGEAKRLTRATFMQELVCGAMLALGTWEILGMLTCLSLVAADSSAGEVVTMGPEEKV